MKTIWIILIICVVVAVLCALAWCCHLFAGNKEYNDTRQTYIQPDLEIGLVEPAKPDRYISQPRTLRVKRLPHNFDGIPMILQRKHFTEPPITPIKATGIFFKNLIFLFERELSLLSRAPSSHWLIERARWGPLVSLWSLEGFASNIVTQVFGTWSPGHGDPAGYPEWGYLV